MSLKNLEKKELMVLADEFINKYLSDGDDDENKPDTMPEPPISEIPLTKQSPETDEEIAAKHLTYKYPYEEFTTENLFSLVAKNADLSSKIVARGKKLYDIFTLFEEHKPALTKKKLAQLNKKLSVILTALQSLEL